jgi:transposase
LTRPDGRDPDGFYQQVAEAYRDVVQTTPKVAKALAEEANVPVGTVHRWIMEARRRGFLPSARQGRAG